MKVTIIVITENEEANIRKCLESAKWADEIIVIDTYSSDNTAAIAGEFTDKVFQLDIKNVTIKRKYSIHKSANEWILFLDADELVTNRLRDEIQSLPENPDASAYTINRENYYFGRHIKHCGISPDYHVRLFNRNMASVNDRIVHEGIEVTGVTAKLEGKLLHNSVPDLFQMVKKMNYYSTLEALEHFENGKKISRTGTILHGLSAFLRTYVSRKGFMDGLAGFFLSFADSATNFLTHLKLLKLQGKI